MIDTATSASSTDPILLRMRGINYRYPDAHATITNIDLSLPQGAFHCLLGRSGCGKSTLLKLAAGLLFPENGAVTLDGETVLKPDTRTSFVFQTPTLLDWASVIDNVLLPISLQRRPDAADIAHAQELLEQVGLLPLQHRYPPQLSGGQQSRVSIARALLTRPRLLLMDEPFAALDALTREELQDSLLTLCSRYGSSVLFVTHDIAEAAYLADRVALMDQGRIIADIAVELDRPRRPALRHSMAFTAVCAHLRLSMESRP